MVQSVKEFRGKNKEAKGTFSNVALVSKPTISGKGGIDLGLDDLVEKVAKAFAGIVLAMRAASQRFDAWTAEREEQKRREASALEERARMQALRDGEAELARKRARFEQEKAAHEKAQNDAGSNGPDGNDGGPAGNAPGPDKPADPSGGPGAGGAAAKETYARFRLMLTELNHDGARSEPIEGIFVDDTDQVEAKSTKLIGADKAPVSIAAPGRGKQNLLPGPKL